MTGTALSRKQAQAALDRLSPAEKLAVRAELERIQARRDGTRRFRRFKTNPALWVAERMREFAWSKQREIMSALVTHRRVAVRSCHGVGKSHIASRAAAWWLDVHPPGEAFVVTTAPTYAQVRAILWRYIRQAHRRAGLPGKVNQTEWHLDGELVAFGRKPSDHDEAAFQGIHARYVLVILDEACGIPEQLWVAADALTTNDDCRILAIGNPDNPASAFRRVCEGGLWHVIGIGAHDSPNFTGEPVPDELRELLISRAWAEEKKAEWGEDNPIYLAKVLGQFPTDNPNAVVRASDVAACRIPLEVPRSPAELTPAELGVDVGGGGDETVVRERRGLVAGREWRDRSDQPEDVARLVVRCILETGAVRVKVDAIGIGWGVCGLLREYRAQGLHKADIVPINVGEAALDPKRFTNRRAELWWDVGRLFSQQRLWDLSSMENADVTVAQLLEPTWLVKDGGRIQVEPKDDIRERLGRSPDNADALLLAFAEGSRTASSFFDQLKAETQGAPR